MVTFDDGQKITVLLAALQERYQALRTIRERVQSIGLWVLGVLAATSGWLIQTKEPLTVPERWVALAGLVFALAVLRGMYLADLQKGFLAQQRTAARLEAALGLYRQGVFDDHETSMYPQGWANAGKTKGGGRFFASTYALIYVGAAFLAVTLMFSK